MIRKLRADDDGIPSQCPNENCESQANRDDSICISNIDGYECMTCGCWFDTDNEGCVEWAYESTPDVL